MLRYASDCLLKLKALAFLCHCSPEKAGPAKQGNIVVVYLTGHYVRRRWDAVSIQSRGHGAGGCRCSPMDVRVQQVADVAEDVAFFHGLNIALVGQG